MFDLEKRKLSLAVLRIVEFYKNVLNPRIVTRSFQFYFSNRTLNSDKIAKKSSTVVERKFRSCRDKKKFEKFLQFFQRDIKAFLPKKEL